MEDMMLDLETMSVNPSNALILSIGMVEFNPKSDGVCELGRERQFILDIREQLLLGRCVDLDTQRFWAEPRMAKAREHWINPGPDSVLKVRGACELVSDFWSICGAKKLWSNGIVFDVANLDSLYRSIGMVPPWPYNAPRDLRTIVRETSVIRPLPETSRKDDQIIPHEPVSDCISQADWLWTHTAGNEESAS